MKWLSREDIVNKKEDFLKSIDPYTEYIESYKQMEEQERRNSKYSKLARFCNDILIEYDKVAECLNTKGLNVKLEYCKGYFRIFQDGKYKYLKCNVSFN